MKTGWRPGKGEPPSAGAARIRRADRAVGIVLGVALGIAIVAIFVFVFSEETVDAPSIDEGVRTDQSAEP